VRSPPRSRREPDEYQTDVRDWRAMLAWLDAELTNTVKE
jgi:hypothetical protein